MLNIHPQYITDYSGEKISVVIPTHEFNNLIEELEDVRLHDEAKKEDNGPSIPIEEAFKMIEAARNSHVE